jgi:hypothetical protein
VVQNHPRAVWVSDGFPLLFTIRYTDNLDDLRILAINNPGLDCQGQMYTLGFEACAKLTKTPYWNLASKSKLDMIEVLCNEVIGSDIIMSEMQRRYERQENDTRAQFLRRESTESGMHCSACNDGGELVVCDSCNENYHSGCVGQDEHTIAKLKMWSCPDCIARGPWRNALRPMSFRHDSHEFTLISGYLLTTKPAAGAAGGSGVQLATPDYAMTHRLASPTEFEHLLTMTDALAGEDETLALVGSIMRQSRENRFLRTFEVKRFRWVESESPLHQAYQYNNLYEAAALPGQLVMSANALTKCAAAADKNATWGQGSGIGFLLAKTKPTTREKVRTCSTDGAANGSLSPLDTANIREKFMDLEHAVTGVEAHFPPGWCRSLFLGKLSKARAIGELGSLLLELEGVLARRAFKPSWEGTPRDKSSTFTHHRQSSKLDVRTRVPPKNTSSNSKLKRGRGDDTKFEILCETAYFALECLRRTRVQDVKKIQQLVLFAIRSTADEDLSDKLNTLCRLQQNTLDHGSSSTDESNCSPSPADLLGVRDLRDGAVGLLDECLAHLLRTHNPNFALPAAFSHTGWLRADVEETPKLGPHLIDPPFYYNTTNQATEWDIGDSPKGASTAIKRMRLDPATGDGLPPLRSKKTVEKGALGSDFTQQRASQKPHTLEALLTR